MSLEGPRKRALFLDRDGVINVDYGYVSRVENFEFISGIFSLVRTAVHELEMLAIVVTNQSGIGRGYFDEAAYQKLTSWMCGRFRDERAPLTAVYHCPFHPEHGLGSYRQDHPWRKPRPGMFLQAARDYSIDLGRSALVGDGSRDILAGSAAGVGLLIRLDPEGDARTDLPPHERVRDLAEAELVLRRRAAGL